MEKMKNLAIQQPQSQVTMINFFGGVDIFKEGWNMAGVLANSDLIPQHFRGKKENCLIALNMAQRMQADPLMVMQNLVIVHGNPTFEAKFAIACFNATGKYSPIRYQEVGERDKDSWGYKAYAIEKASGEVCEGPIVTIRTAKAEGWYNKNEKWKNIPDLMLRYRAASWFIRTTDPGVMMGFQTKEEAEDFTEFEEVINSTSADIPQDANTETLDMGNGQKQTDDTLTQKSAATANDDEQQAYPVDGSEAKVENPTPQNEGTETKPMGKQKMPNIFGEQQ